MQRLLSDAEKLSGIKYDISSYADVVSAIHVIQDEIGITGTTAKEASTTIQGSLGMVKGAWANLLTGMTDEKQDLGKLMQNFLDSVITFADNVIPRISELLPRLIEALEKIVAKLIIQIPNLVLQLLPSLIEGATKLVNCVVHVLPQILGTLTGILPVVLKSIMGVIVGLVAALPRILQPIIAALPSIIKDIVDAIINNLPAIINGLVSLIEMIVVAMPEIMQSLMDYLPTAIEQILYAIISSLPALLKALALMVKAALNYFITVKLGMIKRIPKFLEGIFLGVGSAVSPWYDKMIASISQFWQRIKNKFTEGFSALKNDVVNNLENIKGKFDNTFNRLKEIVRNAIDRIRSFFNFSWSLPKLKMPHIKIDGKFSLSPPKVPKFNIDWYAKAMDSGMIMNKPTIFGYNNATGQLMAGGEAGSETVVGTGSLLNMIKSAVQNENAELTAKLERILKLLERYFPQILENLGFDLVLNTGELVGHTAKAYDEALSDLSNRRRVVFK